MFKALLASIFASPGSAAMRPEGDVAGEPVPVRSYSGFYQPEADVTTAGVWVCDLVTIPMAAHPGESIRLQGSYFAKAIAKQTGNAKCKLVFYLNGVEVHSAFLKSQGDFAIEFVVPELNDIEAASLVIKCSKFFIPKDIGRSEDDRRLSWRMRKLAMGSKTFLDFTQQPNLTLNDRFVPPSPDSPDFSRLQIRTIAFYRQQFRTLPEPSPRREKRFTAWADVAQAVPRYADHHQPHLPIELGFYDVRSATVLPAQVALARKYGIAGFCFEYSWRDGGHSAGLELHTFLGNPALDISFCLCWANENEPTNAERREINSSSQNQCSLRNEMALIESFVPAFKDARYIRIDQKPIFIVKELASLIDAPESAAQWQAEARRAGLPGLYLIAIQANDVIDPRKYGFDATIEFPPHQIKKNSVRHINKPSTDGQNFAARVSDYCDLMNRDKNQQGHDFVNFKTVMPSWDTEPQSPGKGTSFAGATPEQYANWLAQAISITTQRRAQEQLLFINAWNAWSEGAHLEPDQRFGYGYLHATAAGLRNQIISNNGETISSINQSFSKRHDTVIILHIFYEDLIDSIFDDYLSPLATECDLIATVLNDVSEKALEKIKRKFDNCFIIETANRGRDIRPFLIAYRQAHALGYLYACKLHTKKSPQKTDGAKWRMQLFDSLLTPSNNVASILNRFKQSPRLGLLAPQSALRQLGASEIRGRNFKWLNTLFIRLGQNERLSKLDILFPAGSMYWFRITALSSLLDESFVPIDEFEFEAGQLDGTLAHAIERIVGMIGALDQYEVASIPLS